jgi:hypothetical protein
LDVLGTDAEAYVHAARIGIARHRALDHATVIVTLGKKIAVPPELNPLVSQVRFYRQVNQIKLHPRDFARRVIRLPPYAHRAAQFM